MRVFSAFSGVGGLDHPFASDKRFQVIGHCEIDRWAASVLAFHYFTTNHGDITKVVPECLRPFDLLLAGFPCTDISFQGTQKGFTGTKSSLFKMLVPILKAKKPKFVLLENVEALLSEKFSWEFNYVKTELEAAGYQVCYDVFDSSDFGTPQQRRRVFILGVRKDVCELESDSIYDEFKNYKVEAGEGEVKKPENLISWSRSTRENHIDHRLRTDGLANTLTTGKGCNGFSTGNFILEGKGLRLLTPTECEELMGWPKDWTKFGVINGDVVAHSDTQRYRMIGNGVVSKCVEPIKELIVTMNEWYELD